MVKKNSRSNRRSNTRSRRANRSKRNSRGRRLSRKQTGGFIRAPTPQYPEYCGGPNPSQIKPNETCESCSQNGGRRRRYQH